jgi:hypothetical protein
VAAFSLADVEVQQYFGIGGGVEGDALLQQLLFQLLEVENLPVEHDGVAARGVGHGLVAARRGIENRKTTVPQARVAVRKGIARVGAPPRKGIGGRKQVDGEKSADFIEGVDAGNAAHGEGWMLNVGCSMGCPPLNRGKLRIRLIPAGPVSRWPWPFLAGQCIILAHLRPEDGAKPIFAP